jgi:hypothetical protein
MEYQSRGSAEPDHITTVKRESAGWILPREPAQRKGSIISERDRYYRGLQTRFASCDYFIEGSFPGTMSTL